jgi:hypothetical protein
MESTLHALRSLPEFLSCSLRRRELRSRRHVQAGQRRRLPQLHLRVPAGLRQHAQPHHATLRQELYVRTRPAGMLARAIVQYNRSRPAALE